MAVNLCAVLYNADADDVLDVVLALERINARIYQRGEVRTAPWSLRWDPDDFGASVPIQDVRILLRTGKGSCGPLAAAYAAWLRVVEHRTNVWTEVIDGGEKDAWHVLVHAGDEVFDPQTIGAK